MSIPANLNYFFFIWFWLHTRGFIPVSIHVSKARFTWMACHIMHTHRHRREENLHFSNTFMEKSPLPFLAANDRDHRGPGRIGRCLCICQENTESNELPAVCWNGAGLEGVSLHWFYLPRFFVHFCACEKLQQMLRRTSSRCRKQKVKGQVLLVKQEQMFILCRAWPKPVPLRCCPYERAGWLRLCPFWVIRLLFGGGGALRKGEISRESFLEREGSNSEVSLGGPRLTDKKLLFSPLFRAHAGATACRAPGCSARKVKEPTVLRRTSWWLG